MDGNHELTYSTPGSGIGKECAFHFAAEGSAGVVFADLNLPSAEAAAEEAKGLATNPEFRTLAIEVDVASPESVNCMASKAVETFSRLDYAVNCAGVSSCRLL